MPPRRSAARAPSATPARRTRAASSTRSTRATPGPSDADVANPQLPEVQTQESFAYGSTKTPLLPKALEIQPKLTHSQIVEKLDDDIRKSRATLDAHAAEAHQYGRDPAEARDERARRRSQSRDSHEDSITPEPSDTKRGSTTSRNTASRPTSLNPIDEVSIEDASSASHSNDSNDVSPSPSPTIPDWSSYTAEDRHHETGIFASLRNTLTPRRARVQPVAFNLDTNRARARNAVSTINNIITQITLTLTALFWKTVMLSKNALVSLLGVSGQFDRWILEYRLGQLFKLIGYIIVAFLLTVGVLFLGVNTPQATRYARDKAPSLQTVTTTLTSPFSNMFGANSPPVIQISDPKLAKEFKQSLDSYYQKLLKVEGESSDALNKINHLIAREEAFESEVEKDIHAMNRRMPDHYGLIQTHLAPRQINYFSPGTGAVIDPYLTSPTKFKEFSRTVRTVMWFFGGLKKYQSRPPVEALRSWEEQGDCWCSASTATSFTQLAVLLGHAIIPEEVVVEHPPTTASTSPDTAPRQMELWALDPISEAVSEVDGGILGRGWTRLASFEYQALTGQYGGQSHVQTFEVPEVLRPTTKLAVRVLNNWGGDVTCLYRFKVHGRPAVPHREVRTVGLASEE